MSPRGIRRAIPADPTHGVSSFHLWWGGLPNDTAIIEAAAEINVIEPPAVSRLYFWALQVSFSDGRYNYGAAHTGLQWNPNFPRSRAVNWGGYAEPPVSRVFDGSVPDLPGSPADLNTRAFPWEPNCTYRFRVYRSAAGWRSEVTDTGSGLTTVIRDLYAEGDRLVSPTIWSEVFARCVDPPAAVRWSGLEVVLADGRRVSPSFVSTSFPSGGDCPNTDSLLENGALVQRTNTLRTGRDGGRIVLPDSEAPG